MSLATECLNRSLRCLAQAALITPMSALKGPGPSPDSSVASFRNIEPRFLMHVVRAMSLTPSNHDTISGEYYAPPSSTKLHGVEVGVRRVNIDYLAVETTNRIECIIYCRRVHRQRANRCKVRHDRNTTVKQILRGISALRGVYARRVACTRAAPSYVHHAR
jgi:hypothetical protein